MWKLRFMPNLLTLATALVGLGIIFYSIERLWPSVEGYRIKREGFFVDIGYWFLTPTITQGLSLFVIGVLAAFLIVTNDGITRENIVAGRGFLVTLPDWVQVLFGFAMFDFLSYWGHRIHHHGFLWRFHAIHHSPVKLDWLAASRLHPFNRAIQDIIILFPMALLGFNFEILASAFVGSGIIALASHANVRWTFGPIGWFFSTPKFHRWHHTSEELGLDTNFGAISTIWDRIFGTYYMPDEWPMEFGLFGEEVPENLLTQMYWPFLKPQK